ncbi:MAG: hypothetical protein KDC88_12015 [Ignavibacteriae bacterium]|nr:hypothetical protein [Ignavibacteriota bacterium]MCB9205860.1 hypothetical protein [Ignavibacteriales bacterium]MCB9219253.1 hypothetical protein [Ignavibacteriales bacterium]MCB9260142.1 hypothetical protein [Ignavibacteriales bacterium]
MTKLFNKVQQLLEKYSTGRILIILFVITQIVYLLMLLYTIPNLMSYANGMKILDLMPTGYSVDYAKSLFYELGIVGRDYYLFRQIPVDMIYPFLFAVTYSLLLTYLFKSSFTPESKIHYLSILPLFGGFFDYLENIGIILMLSNYPKFLDLLANVTNLFSILKSISTTLFFISLVVGIVGFISKKFKKTQSRI